MQSWNTLVTTICCCWKNRHRGCCLLLCGFSRYLDNYEGTSWPRSSIAEAKVASNRVYLPPQTTHKLRSKHWIILKRYEHTVCWGHSSIPWIFPFLRHMHNIAWFFLGSKNEIPNESGHGLSKCPYRFASSLSFVASRPYLSVWEHEIRRRELPLIFSRSLATTVFVNHQKGLIISNLAFSTIFGLIKWTYLVIPFDLRNLA